MIKYLLIGLGVIYFILTLRFMIKFNRQTILFNRKQRIIHSLLFWAIPFFWILLIKSIIKPIPGSISYEREKEKIYDNNIDFGGSVTGSDYG